VTKSIRIERPFNRIFYGMKKRNISSFADVQNFVLISELRPNLPWATRKRVDEQKRTYVLCIVFPLIRPERHNIIIGFGKVLCLVLPHMCGDDRVQ